jgi:streptogrisin C
MTRTIRCRRLLAALGAGAVLVLATGGQSSASDPQPPPIPGNDPAATPLPGTLDPFGSINPEVAAEVASSEGISVAEARRRLGREVADGQRAAHVQRTLGEQRSGGAYLTDDGTLVITTLDAAGDRVVQQAGARPQRVRRSTRQLDAIMRELDAHATRSGVGAVAGWHVDVETNTVVVQVPQGANDAASRRLLERAARFGEAMRVETVDPSVSPHGAAEYSVGGFPYVTPSGGTCSIGFNAVDSANRNVVVTAGHCVPSGGMVTRRASNGVRYNVGRVRTVNFPGDDFATFWNEYPSYWLPSWSVYRWNNTYTTVRGIQAAPLRGSTVCKSGATTGLTCGRITAVNVTTRWTNGTVVSGMVQHDACVEPGDSGGANITPDGLALGLSSSSNHNQTTKKCLSKTGGVNVSYYQPITEALTRNGLRLLVGR